MFYTFYTPLYVCWFFFFQAEDGIRDIGVTGVQTCALPISCSRAGTDAVRELALEQVRRAAGEFNHLEATRHLAGRVADELAVLRRDHLRELAASRFDDLLELEHDARALERGCGGPGGK